jgi:hypothetical protein
MNKLTQTLLTLLISMGFSGCGGSQNDTPLDTDIPLNYDIPLKTPSTVTGYPLNSSYADNYVIPVNVDSLQFRESQRYGEQWAATFSYARNIWINRISWLGLVENNESMLDGNALFILRVSFGEYKDLVNIPKSLPITEHLVEAEARLIGTLESGYFYEFVYTDYSTFFVDAGNYWISIVDPEIEGIDFSWALTTETSPSSGNRSSVRTTDHGEWQSKNGDQDFEGMAVRLEGGRLIEP